MSDVKRYGPGVVVHMNSGAEVRPGPPWTQRMLGALADRVCGMHPMADFGRVTRAMEYLLRRHRREGF